MPWSSCEHCTTPTSSPGAVPPALQPQDSGTAPVFEGDIRAIVLDVKRPGSRDHIDALSEPLPSQRIGQAAAVVAWLPEQVVQRTRALCVQRQAVFANDAHA